jgi:hypothetical protein
MNECDAPESNRTTAKVSLTKQHTNDHVWSFLGFLHSNLVDLLMNIVPFGSNMNIIGSMGRGRCNCSSLLSTGAWIGTSISEMTHPPQVKHLRSACNMFKAAWVF